MHKIYKVYLGNAGRLELCSFFGQNSTKYMTPVWWDSHPDWTYNILLTTHEESGEQFSDDLTHMKICITNFLCHSREVRLNIDSKSGSVHLPKSWWMMSHFTGWFVSILLSAAYLFGSLVVGKICDGNGRVYYNAIYSSCDNEYTRRWY